MRNLNNGAALAALALAASLPSAMTHTTPVNSTPRRPTPEYQKFRRNSKDIEMWNAEVEAKRKAKKAKLR